MGDGRWERWASKKQNIDRERDFEIEREEERAGGQRVSVLCVALVCEVRKESDLSDRRTATQSYIRIYESGTCYLSFA